MKKIPLDVYLSRRSDEDKARESLEKAINAYNSQDEKYQITLRVSEGESESIVAFMDEIGVARFVVLFLTKSYFESPNCMHELLLIHHYQDSNQRLFPLSIKADDSLNDSHLVTMTKALKNDKKRKKLIELQEPLFFKQGIKDTEEIYPLILEKLKQVDKQILKPLRGNNVPVCEKIDDLLDLVTKAADLAIKAEEQELTRLLKGEIARNLKDLESDQRKYLEREINERDAKVEELAEKLIDLDVDEAMLIVQQWVESQSKNQVQLGYEEWRRFFKPCETIAGWLLLRGIDNTWWIHNKTRLLSTESDKVNCQQVGIGEPAFAEVIIAKSLKEQAVFGLNRYSELILGRLEESFAGYDNIIASVVVKYFRTKSQELLLS